MIIIQCLFAALLLTVIKKFMPMSSSYSFIRLQVIQLQIQLVILFVSTSYQLGGKLGTKLKDLETTTYFFR